MNFRVDYLYNPDTRENVVPNFKKERSVITVPYEIEENEYDEVLTKIIAKKLKRQTKDIKIMSILQID